MHLPRILLAATSSGSGKTLLTCGILQTLVNRGMKVSSFKCGPDYIDPMFHTTVIGTHSRNLDTYFTDEKTTRYLLARNSQGMDIAVMEGVMGFYDGVGVTTTASSYDLARVTGTPVILLVNGKGMSLTMISMIQGMINFREDANIQGVILNQVSQSTYGSLKELIERECGVDVLGYVPNVQDYTLESRHLGLVTPEEIVDLREKLESLASILETCIDIEGLIDIAEQAPHFRYKRPELPKLDTTVRVGVARDSAFCFYYEDNLELMEEMGAELVEFSPMHDAHLPDNIDALYLGGGYPELYTHELSANESMKKDIREKLEGGMSCMAECGGFMYLQEEMEDMKGFTVPMVGFLPGHSYHTDRATRFGYVELIPKEGEVPWENHTTTKGHEFHYFDSTECGDTFIAKKPTLKKQWTCIQTKKNTMAGFPHLYYYSNPSAAFEFLQRAVKNHD